MSADTSSKLFVLMIDLLVGVVGFGLSIGWGKVSGRNMDRDTLLLLAKVWGGLAVFGMALVFIM
jgi:hypothetical protein